MSAVRERQARLLADSRAAEPRARLAQAISRSDFLLRLSRAVSAPQNPDRALEVVADLLVDELVDVAQVLVRTGAHESLCVATRDEAPTTVTRGLVEAEPAHRDALHLGAATEVVVPSSGAPRRRSLGHWFPDDVVAGRVDDLGVETLAVHPLSARGHTFGLLVLGRRAGHGFSGSTDFVAEIAERTATGLDACLLLAETRHVARVLRRRLGPGELPSLPDLDLASYYRVARQSEHVGGDFVDVHPGQGDDVVVVLGDVAGKGVEAAVHAQRIRHAVHTASHVDRDPGRILGLVNRVLVAESDAEPESLATAVCARVRPEGGAMRVDLANAGHPPPLVLRADGRVEPVTGADLLLALDDDVDYRVTTVVLQAGETMLLHTDGITEAAGSPGRYGDERLRRLLETLPPAVPAAAAVEAVAVAVDEHLGDRRHDDLAVLALQYRGGRG